MTRRQGAGRSKKFPAAAPTPPTPQAPAEPTPGRCKVCGREVNPTVMVSHGLRGPHTCVDPDGIVAPYADPVTPAERAAADLYRHERRVAAALAAKLAADAAQAAQEAAAAQQAAQDPGRPF